MDEDLNLQQLITDQHEPSTYITHCMRECTTAQVILVFSRYDLILVLAIKNLLSPKMTRKHCFLVKE